MFKISKNPEKSWKQTKFKKLNNSIVCKQSTKQVLNKKLIKFSKTKIINIG